MFYGSELALLLERNYRPPMMEGFRHFIAQEMVKEDMNGFIENVVQAEEQATFDSHPPLRSRLEALGVMEPQPGVEEDNSPAMGLVNDIYDLELQLLLQRFGPAARRFRPIIWTDSGELAYVPYAHEAAKLFEPALSSNKVSDIPGIISDPAPFMNKVRAHVNVSTTDEPAKVTAFRASLYALVTVMKREGWSVESLPGEPVTMTKNGRSVHPQVAISGFMEEQPDTGKWNVFVTEAGIADLPLYEKT